MSVNIIVIKQRDSAPSHQLSHVGINETVIHPRYVTAAIYCSYAMGSHYDYLITQLLGEDERDNLIGQRRLFLLADVVFLLIWFAM
ncbi:hypothetical protein [Aeromonas piscicola]|uniref:hypothetical protein n=1 Tax=Aeromonas piscicola TaxID=600645 RepID=UPI0021F8718E|nr:hypothetical protein [Aeromonas piscicola]MCW0505516.1 hypothetical protein [Aeromonas piscicola]